MNTRGAKPITINGVHYPSKSAACRDAGISITCLNDRISKGWPEDRWLEASNKSHPITINGVHYKSIAEAAKKHGISEACLYNRLEAGCPESKLLRPSHKDGPGRSVRCIDTGEVFANAQKAADAYYISVSCIYLAARKQTKAAGKRWEYVE